MEDFDLSFENLDIESNVSSDVEFDSSINQFDQTTDFEIINEIELEFVYSGAFLYKLYRTNKDGSKYYICIQRNKCGCNSSITIYENKIQRENTEHHHDDVSFDEFACFKAIYFLKKLFIF